MLEIEELKVRSDEGGYIYIQPGRRSSDGETIYAPIIRFYSSDGEEISRIQGATWQGMTFSDKSDAGTWTEYCVGEGRFFDCSDN